MTLESRIIFRNLQLQVFPGKKVIIVGENGIGKSTLLKLIKGDFDYFFSGSVKTEGTIGYLPQSFENFREQTAFEHLIKETKNFELANLWEMKEKLNKEEWENQFNSFGGFQLTKILSQLKIPLQALERKFKSLSGGEKTKVHLAALCFQNPDILLLDEPTNHLDEVGLNWLEKFLKNYLGIVIMVTHDRYLINQTANYISELSSETHNLTHFHGNYRNYLQEKERQYKRLKQLRNQQEKEIKFIGKKLVNSHNKNESYKPKISDKHDKLTFNFRRGRIQKSQRRITNQLKSKKVGLEENLVEIPALIRHKNEFSFSSKNNLDQVNILIRLQDIEKSYQGKLLFKNLSFELNSGEKVVIKGINGSGKSTLLKIIMGMIKSDKGIVEISEQTKLGYLDQEQETINLNQTVMQFLKNNLLGKLEEKEIWEKIENFGIFYPQELDLPMSKLSIGCQRKAQIVQIILQDSNALILDEPTNHLDLLSLEKIEEQLLNFPGPILVTSHDRYFIKKICNRMISIEEFE